VPSDQDDVSEERLRRIVREEVRAGNRRTLRSVLLVVGGIVVGYLAFSALLGVLLGTVGLGRTVAVAGALLVVGVGWALLDTLRRR
jgi:hypothetical protein